MCGPLGGGLKHPGAQGLHVGCYGGGVVLTGTACREAGLCCT